MKIRAPKLMELARKHNCFGKHSELAVAIEELLFEKKRIRMNIDGANGAILSDMGFDWSIGSGIFMIGRLPGILTHVNEEKTRESAFRKLFEVEESITTGNLTKPFKSVSIFNFKLILPSF